jgi:uracil DNA glycosylase
MATHSACTRGCNLLNEPDHAEGLAFSAAAGWRLFPRSLRTDTLNAAFADEQNRKTDPSGRGQHGMFV